jgi:CelD/BcsL family acetyltransferase involved in cellulose biosynthesis
MHQWIDQPNNVVEKGIILMGRVFRDTDLSITVCRGREGLESLRSTWDQVVAGMAYRRFFHLWEWYHSYLQCLAPDPNNLMFYLFTKGETPVAILPLQFMNISLGGMKLKALASPSHNHMLLCDLVCHREALHLPLFQLLSQHLRNQRESWDMIHLPHLLEDACTIHVIHNRPPSRFLLRHEGRCDFMDTTGNYESFLSGLSKKFRGSLKRAKQSLDELPGVQFTFTQNGPELEEKLNAFMDVEASGWKGALGSGTAIKLHPSLRCFYRTLTRTLSASGKVSINTLTADGKCIAAQFCILLDDTAYTLKMGYDEGYKRYAPGNLLRAFFIKRSMADSAIKHINFITDAEWHRDWNTKYYDKSKLYIFNTTPAGLIGFVILKSYPILNKHYHAYIRPHLPRRIQEWIRRHSHET